MGLLWWIHQEMLPGEHNMLDELRYSFEERNGELAESIAGEMPVLRRADSANPGHDFRWRNAAGALREKPTPMKGYLPCG